MFLGIKIAKKTYGFDFGAFTHPAWNLYECYEDCLKEEYGKFAKKCREDGGVFKCCLTW